ncbi:MAG: hypothetical protein HUU37_08990 [Bdellovibrionales bacterium]|nr:hypothetical protein [Bdellovibrionales bacterium]
MRFLSMLLLLASTSAVAAEDLKAVYGGVVRGSEVIERYSLENPPARVGVRRFAETVARAVRHRYHKQGYEIEGYGMYPSTVAVALKDLQTPTTEFRPLSREDMDILSEWLEDKKVRAVFVMTVDVKKYGGSGAVDEWIFIPTDPNDPAATVSRMTYAE